MWQRDSRSVLILAVYILSVSQRSKAISICDVHRKIIRAADGEVTSPNYPHEYPGNMDCVLVIDGGPHTRITITFLDIGIEEYEDLPGSCRSDALIIQEEKEKRYCGTELPLPYESKGRKVTLRFETDESNAVVERGFKLTFRTTKVLGEGICPTRHIKKKMSGSFFTPNFPRAYPNNKRCKITVYVPDNYMMHVWFTSFHLQRSSRCQHDSLALTDEHGGWKMCGGGLNRIPKPAKMTGRNVKMDFKSDGRKSQTGFHLHYNMTKLTEGSCVCTQGMEYIFVENYKPKIQRAKHTIQFHFKTSQSQGLILFSKGRLRDYIYIGILNGRLFFQTDLGTGRGRVRSLRAGLNDNKWHNVLMSRRDRMLEISVDDRPSGRGTTRGPFNRLDIPDSVGFFLGAPTGDTGLVSNFIGCIRNLSIDGREPITNAFAMKPDYWPFTRNRFSKCRN